MGIFDHEMILDEIKQFKKQYLHSSLCPLVVNRRDFQLMIRIFITGGTLDKRYNELNGELFFAHTHIPAMLEQARCTLTAVTEQLLLKDSLDMTGADREKIRSACLAVPEEKIMITHGTDTMVETAKHLAPSLAHRKTVVLFGAMIPFSIGCSDALFNFGCAAAAVQILPPGVYITMNGRIFNWDNVHKLREEGRFEYLQGNR
jgi:L-asparaginase